MKQFILHSLKNSQFINIRYAFVQIEDIRTQFLRVENSETNYNLTIEKIFFKETNIQFYEFEIIREIILEQKYDPCKLQNWSSALTKIPLTSMSVIHWLMLYELICKKGWFVLGLTVRNIAKQVILFLPKNQLPWHYQGLYKQLYIAASLENDIISSATELKELLRSLNIPRKKINRWLSFYTIFHDKTHQHVPLTDNNLSKYLQNKSIAIVGPASSSSHDASEIDSFDVVVRPNYTLIGKGLDPDIKGQKVTISYFNNEFLSDFIKNSNSSLPNSLKFKLFKNQDQLIRFSTNQKNDCLVADCFDELFFHGDLNLIPYSVVDLLRNTNSVVKVFHIDLMLTNARYSGYKTSNLSQNAQQRILQFKDSSMIHDPALQFYIFKKLLNMNKIKVDQRLKEVLTMTLNEYMNELQNNYL